MATSMYNVFVGSETGLLKAIDVNRLNWSNINSIQEVDRNKEICVLCWESPEEKIACYGLRNREIHTYDIDNTTHGESITFEGGTGIIKGLARVNNNYITAVASGLVRVWNKDSALSEFEAGDKLCCMTQNPQNKKLVATGGDENDLKIWDIENSKEPIFMAKNVRDDWLNLRVPVKVLGAQFVPNSEEIVTCTGYHQVRLYDPRGPQRRPMVDMKFDEYPLMSMGLCNTQPHQVVVGNTQGKTALLDFRKGKIVHCFKGFAGSVRSIQCHPTLPLMASCGLDRFVRIHHIETRELLHKFYLKSRLNCLLLSNNWQPESESKDEGIDMNEDEGQEEKPRGDVEKEGEAEDDDDNDVWDQLEVLSVKKPEAGKSAKVSGKDKVESGRTLRQSTRKPVKRSTDEATVKISSKTPKKKKK